MMLQKASKFFHPESTRRSMKLEKVFSQDRRQAKQLLTFHAALPFISSRFFAHLPEKWLAQVSTKSRKIHQLYAQVFLLLQQEQYLFLKHTWRKLEPKHVEYFQEKWAVVDQPNPEIRLQNSICAY